MKPDRLMKLGNAKRRPLFVVVSVFITVSLLLQAGASAALWDDPAVQETAPEEMLLCSGILPPPSCISAPGTRGAFKFEGRLVFLSASVFAEPARTVVPRLEPRLSKGRLAVHLLTCRLLI